MSAICCVISEMGNRADQGRLEKVRRTFVNDKRDEFAELVAQAVRRMDYRFDVEAHPEYEENGGPAPVRHAGQGRRRLRNIDDKEIKDRPAAADSPASPNWRAGGDLLLVRHRSPGIRICHYR